MNLADYIYKDGEEYYFDTENYTDQTTLGLSLDYEDGDKIIWKADGKKYSGVLKSCGVHNELFVIRNVKTIE